MTPITPLETSVEMFQRGAKTQSFFAPRTERPRPLSEATEMYDTDFEDDSSEFEEDSPKYSFESSDSRRSQTTLSSFEEVMTPQSGHLSQFNFSLPLQQQRRQSKPVEGPRGPHLFRSSSVSSELQFDYALQLSPVAPKEMHIADVRFASQTPLTIVPGQQFGGADQFGSLDQTVANAISAEVREWSAAQVATWMHQNGFEESIIEKMEEHDITGPVLLDMQFEDLKELDIPSFGKRHQLWNLIDALRDNDGRASPAVTPFQDISRPCTRVTRASSTRNRSRSRGARPRDDHSEECGAAPDCGTTPITPGGGNRPGKRRGRKHRNFDDVVTPMESVSIVAIEQLLPKPHKCAKGERCAKWRKQQRQIQRLTDEHGMPISPEKGGHIFMAGDPGNAGAANKVVKNVFRPTSDAIPSVVASSAALPADQVPAFSGLDEEMLQAVEQRDPQENVKHFLTLQGIEPPTMAPQEDEECAQGDDSHCYARRSPIESPPTPPLDLFPPLQPPQSTPGPHSALKTLPRLSIPRAASANPHYPGGHAAGNTLTALRSAGGAPDSSSFSPCRSATASPFTALHHHAASPGGGGSSLYRFGTPCSAMDVPLTAVPLDPCGRDASQSVPPNMLYREQSSPLRAPTRSASTRGARPGLPSLQEGRVLDSAAAPRSASPSGSAHSGSTLQGSTSAAPRTVTLPHGAKEDKASMATLYPDATHAGWMKKRRTRLLRHEWADAHFRLTGTRLALHKDALPQSGAVSTIDVDEYAVACSSIASNKLAAKLKALRLSERAAPSSSNAAGAKPGDTDAFAFQLVPQLPEGQKADGGVLRKRREHAAAGKTHHFAVRSRDERIDWMRELMLAKALRAKEGGAEVRVNGRDV